MPQVWQVISLTDGVRPGRQGGNATAKERSAAYPNGEMGLEGSAMMAIRNTRGNLVEAIWADEWPRNGAVVDSGLRTPAGC